MEDFRTVDHIRHGRVDQPGRENADSLEDFPSDLSLTGIQNRFSVDREGGSAAFQDGFVHGPGATQSPACIVASGRGASGRRKPQSTTAEHGIVRRSPVKRSSTTTPSARTSRVMVRRSMRTPAWARRTLAGARSPLRASSLPAMWSCVTSTARVAELLGQSDADRSADRVEHDHVTLVRQRHLTEPQRGDVDHRGIRGDGVVRATRPRSGALHDDIARPSAAPPSECARRHRAAPPRRPTTRRAGRSDPPPPPARPAVEDRSTSVTRCPRSAATRAVSNPAGPPPTTTMRRDTRSRARPLRILRLPARRRFADARHERVANVAHLARLVAAGARPDPLRVPGAQLGDEIRVGDQRPRHLNTCAAGIQRRQRVPDRDDRALRDHRHVHDAGDQRRQVDVDPRRLVEVGSRLLDREDRATNDDEVVDSSHQLGSESRRLLRRDPGPRRQLVARQPQSDHPRRSDRCPHRGQHVPGEPQPIRHPTHPSAGSSAPTGTAARGCAARR